MRDWPDTGSERLVGWLLPLSFLQTLSIFCCYCWVSFRRLALNFVKWICLIPSLQGLSGTGSLDFERVEQEELALQSAQPLWAHFQV